jgi:hypothetical protein
MALNPTLESPAPMPEKAQTIDAHDPWTPLEGFDQRKAVAFDHEEGVAELFWQAKLTDEGSYAWTELASVEIPLEEVTVSGRYNLFKGQLINFSTAWREDDDDSKNGGSPPPDHGRPEPKYEDDRRERERRERERKRKRAESIYPDQDKVEEAIEEYRQSTGPSTAQPSIWGQDRWLTDPVLVHDDGTLESLDPTSHPDAKIDPESGVEYHPEYEGVAISDGPDLEDNEMMKKVKQKQRIHRDTLERIEADGGTLYVLGYIQQVGGGDIKDSHIRLEPREAFKLTLRD